MMRHSTTSLLLAATFLLYGLPVLLAQSNGQLQTANSPYATLYSVDIDKVAWDGGFWGDRFDVCKDTMLLNMWRIFDDAELSHAYRNFEIAAGYAQGEHRDPAFFDGDMYKWLEGACAVYALTKDATLKQHIDSFVTTLIKAQRADGYLHTQTLIRDKNNPGQRSEFAERLHFETYNFGHLMSAACMHYRATGERRLLETAVKATDFLYRYYKSAPAELAQNAICPSHYMGVADMYRTTHDPRYLELAKGLIDIRGLVVNGTDDNQDRIPFRQQHTAMGHAVRANYLYAGVADLYLETGEDSLLTCLNDIWNDVVHTKMYVTGACGALYDGTSPDGTNYTPDSIQKTHQSYGRSFQLPNMTAHNETCANIGNVLWNRRMLHITGEAKYTDILELALYNSVLSGISLEGKDYFYTNPLAASNKFPYTLRWSEGKHKQRQPWISCFCCPPNTVRTVAETQQYAYGLSDNSVWVHLYGSNHLNTQLKDGTPVCLKQVSDYPWDGRVSLTWDGTTKQPVTLRLRIPGWCQGASLTVNGQPEAISLEAGTYVALSRSWKQGDRVELNLPMPVRLLEANPLVEETRNQVAVTRGPLVYCLESSDLPANVRIEQVLVPLNTTWKPIKTTIAGSPVVQLEGQLLVQPTTDWSNALYRVINPATQPRTLRLVPYYAWSNRGQSEMSVWLPLKR